MLSRGELDGFMVTKPSYYYYARKLLENGSLGRDIRHVRLVRTEKSFVNNNLVAGILLKEEEDYNIFRKYFESNWPTNQGCYMSQLNAKEKRFAKKEKVNPMLGLFFPFFTGCSGVVGLIVCFGIIYEWKRRKVTTSNAQQWIVAHTLSRRQTNLGEVSSARGKIYTENPR